MLPLDVLVRAILIPGSEANGVPGVRDGRGGLLRWLEKDEMNERLEALCLEVAQHQKATDNS